MGVRWMYGFGARCELFETGVGFEDKLQVLGYQLICIFCWVNHKMITLLCSTHTKGVDIKKLDQVQEIFTQNLFLMFLKVTAERRSRAREMKFISL